ncbi:ABC transporter permease [Nocardia seriolae]|uniref:ABC transporter permease n=1 Tax=Nocardia seriolae TaxID=37332 RepID=UPI0011918856|nr:ABC transporter permease [Nocardia seriolae]GEM22895.1 putative ABC transporter, membrane protein [Nocardia seriolae NBRC 15557]
MGVLTAERIKLTSTRSPWWCSAVVVLLGLGFAVLGAVSGRAAKGDNSDLYNVSLAVSGVSGLGVMVLMIMATLSVTSEYRFGVIRTSFLATPARTRVITAKAGLQAVYATVLTAVLSIVAYFAFRAIYGAKPGVGLSTAEEQRALFGVPVYALLCAILAVAVGVLVRQSAAAISILLLWPLLLETLLGAFGSFGRNVGPLLPFRNAQRFFTMGSDSRNWHWGVWGSLIYFAVFVAVIFGAAILVVNKRDA